MLRPALHVAEAGNTIEPARPVKLGHQEAPPYIRELSSQFAAVSTRVVLRGQSNFVHNEMCAHLFMSTEQANELYASNTQASKRARARGRHRSCRGFLCLHAVCPMSSNSGAAGLHPLPRVCWPSRSMFS